MSTSDSSTTPPTDPAAIAEPVRKLRLLADTLAAMSAEVSSLTTERDQLRSRERDLKAMAGDPYWFDIATAERALSDQLAAALQQMHDIYHASTCKGLGRGPNWDCTWLVLLGAWRASRGTV